MAYNLTSGWGSIEAQVAAATKRTTGKVFLVAAAGLADRGRLERLFGYRADPDGVVRFFTTIDAAISACTADRGDVVLVAPGHTETVTAAGGIAQDVANVSVIGLGDGDNAPSITFGTSTAASWTVSADDCVIENIRGVAGIDALINPFNVTGGNPTLNIRWDDASAAVEAARAILLTDLNGARVKLDYRGFAAGNAVVNAIRLNNVGNTRIEIDAYGVCTTAWVEFVTVLSDNVVVVTPPGGQLYTSGITGGTRNVVDTITGSLWSADIWDGSAGARQRGGSAEALAFDDVGDIASALALATQDSTANSDIGDQVGNKTDTAVADTIEGNAMTTQSLNRMVKAALQRLGADSANNTAATTLVAANRDGSVLERLEDIRQSEGFSAGAVYQGACDAGMGASTTAIVSADLAGHGNDFFNTKYYMQVLLNVNSVGNAPEFEVRQITDYVSATGTFTVTAFSVNVEASDEILIVHESLVTLGRDDANNTIATTNVASNADGSVLERQEFVQAQIGTLTNTGGTATIGAIIGDVANIDLVTRLNTIDDFIDTEIGTIVNTGGTASIGGVLGDLANDSLVARLNDIGTNVDATTTDSIQGKLGTDTELADRSLYDIVNGGGPAAAAAAAAPANDVSLYGALRDVWDAVRNGTGGAEPATNRAVMDYLGVSPAFFVPGLGFRVTKAGAMTAVNDDLFDITGKVAITLLEGEVTSALDANVTTVLLRVKTDNVNLCAATTVTSDVDGTQYLLNGDFGDALNGGSTPVVRAAEGNSLGGSFVVGNAGVASVIEHLLGAADLATGVVTWTLFYLPLEAGATVAASA